MLSDNQIIIALATIVVLGVGAQWIGALLGFPSLLLLLPAGLLAGDISRLVSPRSSSARRCSPLVTLLVAVALPKRVEAALRRPARGGAPARASTHHGWAGDHLLGGPGFLAILNIDKGLAFLLGAIISVSGPTVVGPLLSTVRAREPTSWCSTTGHVSRSAGATLGVVMLNLVLAGHRGGVHPCCKRWATRLGVAVGLVAAAVLVFVMSRNLLTDDMQTAVALCLRWPPLRSPMCCSRRLGSSPP